MQRQYSGLFLNTSALLLGATGLAKLLSGLGDARILSLSDPILGVAFGKLLPAVGFVEVLVALACFWPGLDLRLKLGLVAWLATNFLLYRLGFWAVGWHHPCSCMGSLAGALHLSDQAADNIMKGILAYLLLGSYVLLLIEFRGSGRPAAVTAKSE